MQDPGQETPPDQQDPIQDSKQHDGEPNLVDQDKPILGVDNDDAADAKEELAADNEQNTSRGLLPNFLKSYID